MIRALWTGASGMIAQQDAVDTISNNLANVNTVGYKKETVDFKTLLYSKIQTKTTDNNGNPKPVIAQVGAGVRTSAITSRYTQGTLTATENPFDFALEGAGFFQVQMPDGSVGYTRNGSFNITIGTEGLTLATADGYPVLTESGEPIIFSSDKQTSAYTVDEDGKFWYRNEDGIQEDTGMRLGVVQFNNPSGLFKLSGSYLSATAASGEPMAEAESTELQHSKVISKYLESSNVQTVDEMVNLIVAQRAYEMNSKVINAADQMLQQANNLRS